MIVKFGLLLTISCFIFAEVHADVGEYVLMNINSTKKAGVIWLLAIILTVHM